MIVLLQTGKGADMGAAFGGGGSQTFFGSTGASTFLSTATTWAAVIFMLTCLTLAYLSSHRTGSSIMKNAEIPAAEEKTDAETASPLETSAETKAVSEEGAADTADSREIPSQTGSVPESAAPDAASVETSGTDSDTAPSPVTEEGKAEQGKSD